VISKTGVIMSGEKIDQAFERLLTESVPESVQRAIKRSEKYLEYWCALVCIAAFSWMMTLTFYLLDILCLGLGCSKGAFPYGWTLIALTISMVGFVLIINRFFSKGWDDYATTEHCEKLLPLLLANQEIEPETKRVVANLFVLNGFVSLDQVRKVQIDFDRKQRSEIDREARSIRQCQIESWNTN
jgi:hypothetical protein